MTSPDTCAVEVVYPWSDGEALRCERKANHPGQHRVARPPEQPASIRQMCECNHERQFHGNDNLCAGCMGTSQERHPFNLAAPSQSVEALKQAVMDSAPLRENVDAALDALIEAVRGEQEAVMNVMSSTFADVNDSRFEWKARAEAAEAEVARLKADACPRCSHPLRHERDHSMESPCGRCGCMSTTSTSNEVKLCN
jgi:hypothetical protein